MNDRLFGVTHAFDHPMTRLITLIIAGLLILSVLVITALSLSGLLRNPLRQEIIKRTLSWLVITPLIVGPILLGAAYTIGAVAILSLLCYREYARATGLFRERLISLIVVLGILAVTFAIVDHWYNFFVALFPLTVGMIAITPIFTDRPQGYIQRVALGVFGFVLFGSAMGHLGYMANDTLYRPIVLMVFLAVELNDVFAFIVGKSLGRRKLLPNTSPSKTVAGAMGALVLTTSLVFFIGQGIFKETILGQPPYLIVLGILISGVGQLGDLMLSSIKRDLGIKDIGAVIPGHGGLLDRFNSLILVAPAVFHYVGYFRGFGLDQPTRIITGG